MAQNSSPYSPAHAAGISMHRVVVLVTEGKSTPSFGMGLEFDTMNLIEQKEPSIIWLPVTVLVELGN
jgi:hypothetical protein